MPLQAQADDQLTREIGGQRLTSAAVAGNEGGVWAQSESFPQVAEERGFEGATKSISEPVVETEYISDGVQMMEKDAHFQKNRDSVNADVIEGRPYERVDGIVGDDGHNHGGDDMSESCVEIDLDPLVTPPACHRAEEQKFEGATKSNSEPMETKYNSDGAQMMEKVAHFVKNGDSVNADVIEGHHPYEREGGIVGDDGHNHGGDNISESCVESSTGPLVAPLTCHRAEEQRLEGATKSNSEPMETKFISDGAQMVEKVAHFLKNGDSVNADVIEGNHPYERESGIVGDDGRNHGGDNMSESCVEAGADPLVAPFSCHITDGQGLESENKSNCEPVEAKYISDGTQMMEKVSNSQKNGNSVNFNVIEGHPYVREGEIIGDDGHDKSEVNYEFSAKDQNLIDKGLACMPECAEAPNDSMGHHALDETVVSYEKSGISLETFQGAMPEPMGGETALAQHSMVDSNQVEVYPKASCVENDQKIYDENTTVVEKTVLILDSFPTTEQDSGSQQMGGDMKTAFVRGNTVGDCGVAKTSMTLDAAVSAEACCPGEHPVDDSVLEKDDFVTEDNDFAISDSSAQLQNGSAQQKTVYQNQKEESFMMDSIKGGDEACASYTMKDSSSLFESSIPKDSAELDNLTVPPQLNEPFVGSQDLHPSNVPSMKHGQLEPEHAVDEGTDCCQSLQDGKCENLKKFDNQNDASAVEKEDFATENNGFAIGDSSTELRNDSAQQNIVYQNQKEESSFMIDSFKGEDETHASYTMKDSSSLFGSSIPQDSAELDNQTVSPQLNEPFIGSQDLHPSNVLSMEHGQLEPEHGVDEATDCCQSLQDGKCEHRKESDNQNEGCIDTSTESSSTNQQATYDLSFPEKEGFSTSDLVWGKVKSHPWWPGQIFDVSGASKLALKYQKKDNFLVAYFGDKTFAWCEESRLKPFQLYFSQMEKQATSESFLRALHDLLFEISRRVELSMTCLCLPEETYADIEYQKVENAGVRGKNVSPVIDRYEVVNYFHPDKFLEYVRDLAQLPTGGADRLELTVAQAQLKAYSLSKGYTELPSFINGSGLVENDFEIPTSMSKSPKVDDLDHSATLKDLFSTKGKSRVRDGTLGKQKHLVEDSKKQKSLSELMEEETAFIIANGNENASEVQDDERLLSSGNKRKAGFFSSDIERIGTKKIDSHVPRETKFPSQTFNSSFKVGEFISRAASKLTCGQPIRKCHGEKTHDWAIDYMDIDDFLDTPFDNPKLQIDISEDYPPANEMLSKLCLVARNPLKGYNFSFIVISFFSAFRNLQVSNSSIEVIKTEKPRAKRGRKKKIIPEFELPDSSTPDHMKDSYWSDMIVPEKDAILNLPKRRGRKKKKFFDESPPSQMLNSQSDCENKLYDGSTCHHVKHILIAERPIISVEEKIIDERTPTAMILYFNCSNSLPSETDLIRTFSRYGPLKEDETSIETKNNSAMVVYKKRADAEMAFSSAGKFSTFGPALLSYRLRHFPVKSPLTNTLKVEEDTQPIKGSKQGILEEPESESAFGRNLSENIPTVQFEGADRGPSHFGQTHEDATNVHVEIGGAGEFFESQEDVPVETETGLVSGNTLLESLDQELSYFDQDFSESKAVSGNMQVENVSHAEVVTGTTSDSRARQLEDRSKDIREEVQPRENKCSDSAPAHAGTETSV